MIVKPARQMPVEGTQAARLRRSYRTEDQLRMRHLTSLQRQLDGYRLTTAEILYHLPDHPKVLQTYVWQDLDIAPDYPVLGKFLQFWQREIEGKLHSVRVGSARLISAGEMRHTDHLLHMH